LPKVRFKPGTTLPPVCVISGRREDIEQLVFEFVVPPTGDLALPWRLLVGLAMPAGLSLFLKERRGIALPVARGAYAAYMRRGRPLWAFLGVLSALALLVLVGIFFLASRAPPLPGGSETPLAICHRVAVTLERDFNVHVAARTLLDVYDTVPWIAIALLVTGVVFLYARSLRMLAAHDDGSVTLWLPSREAVRAIEFDQQVAAQAERP
jgi:hypothetical protein